MKVISVNVGVPKEVNWKGKTVLTGIFKDPVAGKVKLKSLNFQGDQQADLTVHGGVTKAVYAYPLEHYDYWRHKLPEMNLSWGIFGENLTIEGLLEEEVNIGDRFRLGGAEIMATEPRMPCYKLGIRFGRNDIVKKFLDSRLTGVYFSVLKEGDVGVGDTLELISQDENNIKVADITRLYVDEIDSSVFLHRILQVEALPIEWKERCQKKLDKFRGY